MWSGRMEVFSLEKLLQCVKGLNWKVKLPIAGGCLILSVRVLYTIYQRSINDRKRYRKQKEIRGAVDDLAARLRADPLPRTRVDYITGLNIAELVEELKAGKIRPIEALRAYQTKALEAHRVTNCLVEPVKEAEERALELEKQPRNGLLWGVPLSIKDDVGIKGYDCTAGMIVHTGTPMKANSAMLSVLLNEGAIPFVKTNVPQTEMSFEPGNPISGVVHNPHKHGYGPGGSSSGEAALIASGGSILGVGSDLGGSIRVPAHFCGVCGFKPTPERMSARGHVFDEPVSYAAVRPVWGPLARSVEGLVLQMKSYWNGSGLNKYDPQVPRMPFNSEVYDGDRKLRIGYYADNHLFPTFPGCVRAIEIAKDILAAKGHEIVPWSPPDIERCLLRGEACLFADGGEKLREQLKYDRVDPTISHLFPAFKLPSWLVKLMAFIIRPLDALMAERLSLSCGVGSAVRYLEMNFDIIDCRRQIHDSWQEAGLDVVLCPPNVMVAPPLGSSSLLTGTCIYSFTYNVLHLPAGTVPIKKVCQSDLNTLDSAYSSKDRLQKSMREAMEKTLDLPVGVMVVGAAYMDELCLRVMRMLETA